MVLLNQEAHGPHRSPERNSSNQLTYLRKAMIMP